MLHEIMTLQEAINEELLMEMANIKSTVSGLPYDIWLDPHGKDRNNTHNSPRVKVVVGDEMIPIELTDEPDVPDSVKKLGKGEFRHKALVLRYIKAYRKIMLAHYDLQINDTQALNLIGTLRQAPEAELRLADMIDLRPNIRVEFEWDEQEFLYEVQVVTDKEVLATSYALDNTELFSQVTKFQHEYSCNKVVNRGKGFHEDN